MHSARARFGALILAAALGASLAVTVSPPQASSATPALVSVGISSASESGKTVTIKTTQPHGFQSGTGVWVSGVNIAGYNGLWTVKSTTSTTFSYIAKAKGLKRSNGGIAANGVPKPDAMGLRLPWTTGVQNFITQAYGTHFSDGVTPDHWNFQNGAQDYYALDFGLSQGQAVYPVAAGTVKYAGWGGTHVGCIIVIDHVVPGSTTHVWSEYAHLGVSGTTDAHSQPACSPGATLVHTGDKITSAVKPIGAAGTTGNVAPHLHFAMYEDTANHTLKMTSGWDGYGQRPTGGIAVIAEPFVGDQVYENFQWWNLTTGAESYGMTAEDLAPFTGAVCSAVASKSCKWATTSIQEITHPSATVSYQLNATAPNGLKEVQLTASYKTNGTGAWPVDTSGWSQSVLASFAAESNAIWPVVAVCHPPDTGNQSQTDSDGCVWSNINRPNGASTGPVTAATISYAFPVDYAVRRVDWEPWASRPWPATAPCVDMKISFNVYDLAGGRKLAGDKVLPAKCGGAASTSTINTATSSASGATVSAQKSSGPQANIVYLEPAQPAAESPNAWPMFRDDPSHDGTNAAEDLLSPSNVSQLSELWSTGSSDLFSSPAIADGVVYVGLEIGADHGGILYTYPDGCGASTCVATHDVQFDVQMFPNSSPAVQDGMVYMGSEAWNAPKCSATGCTVDWWAGAEGEVYAAPTLANGVVYLGTLDNDLYAMDSQCDGPRHYGAEARCSPLWSGATNGKIFSSAAVADGLVFVGSDDTNVYAFPSNGCGASTCNPAWSGGVGGDVRSSPAVANNSVYIGSLDGNLYSFTATGCNAPVCSPLWVGPTGGPIWSSPAVADGVVYVGSDDGNLYAFSQAGCGSTTCTPLWSAPIGYQHIDSSPVVANGVVFIGSDNNTGQNLFAFAADGCGSAVCEPIWSTNTGYGVYNSPAISNGKLYVVSGGALRVYGLPE